MTPFAHRAGFVALAMTLTFAAQAAETTPAQVKGTSIRGGAIRSGTSTNVTPPTAQAALAAAAPAVSTPASTTPDSEGYIPVAFNKLAGFTYNIPEGVVEGDQLGKSEVQIPQEVRDLNRKKVALSGYMLPLKVDNGKVTEMLIMKDQSMCCYGAIPRINDWVSVKMKSGGVPSIMDDKVTLRGEMRVGEMLENGYLVGIYEMTGEKMEKAKVQE